jgi:hypothetical protein
MGLAQTAIPLGLAGALYQAMSQPRGWNTLETRKPSSSSRCNHEIDGRFSADSAAHLWIASTGMEVAEGPVVADLDTNPAHGESS